MQFDLSATGTLQQAYSPLMYRPTKRWATREVDWRAYTDRLVIFPLNVSADMTGSASLVLSATGVLTGQAAASGSAAIVFGGAGTLLGAGRLAGSSALAFDLTGTLGATTSGDMAGVSALQLDAIGTLYATGALLGNAAMILSASATPSQQVAISGQASMVLGASGTIFDAGSGAIQTLPSRITLRVPRRTIARLSI
jgi:hypothetical protein